MYLSYYEMEFNPFCKEIETKKSYETEDLKIVTNRLEYLKENPGLALFTGNAGTGKTFSIRKFIDNLNPNIYLSIYISFSSITVMDFYRQLAIKLGIEPSSKKVINFRMIQETIIEKVKNKKQKIIIIIDEAQYLKTDIINDLKMLINFDMDSKNYFTLILMGQPILNNILNRNVHEAIRQRIAVSYNFNGINKEELEEYINSRLNICHGKKDIFDPQAIQTIYDSCNGSLRVANNIINKSLIIGANNKKDIITNDTILEAYNDLVLG